MSNNNYNDALAILTVGEKYLNLVSAVAMQIAGQGNQTVVLSNRPLTIEEYDDQSRWSDTNMSLPLLFNFYHGLETILKGFIKAQNLEVGAHHKLSVLLEEFEKLYPDEQLSMLMTNYIYVSNLSSPLKEFFENNDITPDMFHQALKYTDVGIGNNQKIVITHLSLKYGGTEASAFYEQLAADSEKIRKLSVKLLSRELKTEPG